MINKIFEDELELLEKTKGLVNLEKDVDEEVFNQHKNDNRFFWIDWMLISLYQTIISSQIFLIYYW